MSVESGDIYKDTDINVREAQQEVRELIKARERNR